VPQASEPVGAGDQRRGEGAGDQGGVGKVDLNRWLSGAYVVPGIESEDEGSE
jgi:hypothetical protein